MKRLVILCALCALLLVLLSACRPFGPRPTPTVVPTITAAVAEASPTATTRPTPVATATPRPTNPPTLPPVATAALPPVAPSALPGVATAAVGGDDAALLQAMDAIGREMETVRELDATHPITRSIMSREALTQYLIDEFNRDYPEDELKADVQTMAAFDFIPADFDLRRSLVDVYGEQVLGFYDDETKALNVVSDTGLDLLARITLAHEYTHGLQDEHFNLTAFMDEDRLNDDEYLARQAVVEGDATVAMTQYLMAHLSDITLEDFQQFQAEVDKGQPALENAPEIISASLTFPYYNGEQFVTLLQQDGWQAVDAAYARPPASTEQILHPDKYFAGEPPIILAVPPLTDTLGAGWGLVETETLGEYQMRLYLRQQVAHAAAERAAAGWGGDRYAVYGKGDDTVLVWLTAWDTPADREEFVDTYSRYAEAKYGAPPAMSGDTARWSASSQSAYLSWSGTSAALILAPDAATLDRVVGAVRP